MGYEAVVHKSKGMSHVPEIEARNQRNAAARAARETALTKREGELAEREAELKKREAAVTP